MFTSNFDKCTCRSSTPLSRFSLPKYKHTNESLAVPNSLRTTFRTLSLGEKRSIFTPHIDPAPRTLLLFSVKYHAQSKISLRGLSTNTSVAIAAIHLSAALSNQHVKPFCVAPPNLSSKAMHSLARASTRLLTCPKNLHLRCYGMHCQRADFLNRQYKIHNALISDQGAMGRVIGTKSISTSTPR